MAAAVPPQPNPQQKAPPRERAKSAGCLSVVMYVITAILAGLTLLAFSTSDADVPKCNDKLMSPGDECLTIGGPSNGEVQTYDDVLQDIDRGQRFRAWWRLPALIVTGISLAVAVWLSVLQVRWSWQARRDGQARS